ncbi:glutamate-5-semialdehyde dehydrogenase [Rhodoplanes elegans]|uniref:Gamma-glutamyl phosphate reductase n=2 Tax=Rhodoplanes elegans TaxID=29408 RepID=A0A327KPJ5_9BRAD|nr:glutamate-5-semialdehyde dehydrogenase [Rhodoplanes elegans]RAI39816.1 glutamate-5-semialdehyde dehydrogenase [Rhodoplanes elegans]
MSPMSATLTTPGSRVTESRGPEGRTPDLTAVMADIGRRARAAAGAVALASAIDKSEALIAMAEALRAAAPEILAANAEDVSEARSRGATAALIDRLKLDEKRVAAMAEGIEIVAALADPVGAVMEAWTRPNGMTIERVRVPLGVIGVIYESRPNVTADAGALCLKAGNAVILRGGSDSFRSSRAIHAALVEGLRAADMPEDAIQLVPTRDRAAVGLMLGGLDGNIDVIVPRGGKDLVARVQAEARVPVFSHLDGNCHVYVDAGADLAMAKTILMNAKLRRTGVCGAAETLLVDRAVAATHLAPLVTMLLDAGCEVRGDAAAQAVDARVKAATEADWATEYLDAIIAAKVVDGVDEAIRHVNRYGSHHTDAIVTADQAAAERFLAEVDSAIVLHNASTQFADGGEFGFGAEIGIATGRLHARGPVGVEQLTTFKYRIRGSGQTRP